MAPPCGEADTAEAAGAGCPPIVVVAYEASTRRSCCATSATNGRRASPMATADGARLLPLCCGLARGARLAVLVDAEACEVRGTFSC